MCLPEEMYAVPSHCQCPAGNQSNLRDNDRGHRLNTRPAMNIRGTRDEDLRLYLDLIEGSQLIIEPEFHL